MVLKNSGRVVGKLLPWDYFRFPRNPPRIDARRGDPSYKLAYQALAAFLDVSVIQHSLKRSLLEAMK
jgi:hypothetical protein